MELYGKILLFAMPVFLFFVLLEKGYGILVGKETVRTMDMISSLSSGLTNSVKDVLGLSVSILTYSWLVKHIAVFSVQNTVVAAIIAFIVLDFQGYWVHRWAHKINFFWNKHAVHHSSEDFNLACALRQSISSFVTLFTFFLIPAALLGVPREVIAIVAPIHLFAQFWYHTEHIKRMGFLEHIIVTPSHHRVHHAINPEYMDKNFAQIFIVFDKWFGTFQEEMPDVPPVYGITRPAQTWNPIKINFQHLWLLIKDAWRAADWRDKLLIWFKPTGWRPADVEARFPVPKIDDPYTYEKYETKASAALMAWAWVQFISVVVLVFYFFGNIKQIGTPNLFIYGGFLFLSIYSYTELMDRNRYALAWETGKNTLGLWLIFSMGDWFGASAAVPSAALIVAVFFVLSTLITAYFVLIEFKNEAETPKSMRLSV
jgi:alkylglycerol monooxygenase